jgi:hypothetical protein
MGAGCAPPNMMLDRVVEAMVVIRGGLCGLLMEGGTAENLRLGSF